MLIPCNVHFGVYISIHPTKIIEMFFKDIQQNGDVRRMVPMFQLVRRQLKDDQRFGIYFFNIVKSRLADISHQQCVAS